MRDKGNVAKSRAQGLGTYTHESATLATPDKHQHFAWVIAGSVVWDTQSEQGSGDDSAFLHDDVEAIGCQLHCPAVAGSLEVQIHDPHAFGLSLPPSGFDRFRSRHSHELWAPWVAFSPTLKDVHGI